MANPKNKQELLASMTDGYAKLCEQIAKMSDEEKTRSFDFAADPKKCGVRWQYDRCLRDLLIHLCRTSVMVIPGIICPTSIAATTTRWIRCWSRSIKTLHWMMPSAVCNRRKRRC